MTKTLPNKPLKAIGSWSILILVLGALIGLSCALLLYALDLVTSTRQNTPILLFFLPAAGLLIALISKYTDPKIDSGMTTLFEGQRTEAKIPKLMAPVIFLTTLITHLIGGSAGREGTAVQMGAGIAAQCTTLFRFFQNEQQTLIRLGMGAGFAALFGTPWAGLLFALELSRFQNSTLKEWLVVGLGSFWAYYVCHFTGAPHTLYEAISPPEFSVLQLVWISVCAALFGLTAFFYTDLHALYSKFLKKLPFSRFWLPVIGGTLLLALFQFPGTEIYQGLGLETIQSSFKAPAGGEVFLLKIIFTVLTLSFGFKGGEVTPLFFIGATLGSALSLIVPLPLDFLAALGFVCVFAGATKTFLACSIMGFELFGVESLPYFILACFMAQIFSGKKSIYAGQPENKWAFFG